MPVKTCRLLTRGAAAGPAHLALPRQHRRHQRPQRIIDERFHASWTSPLYLLKHALSGESPQLLERHFQLQALGCRPHEMKY